LRYADASHLHLTAFHARRPLLGSCVRIAGYLTLVAVLAVERVAPDRLAWAAVGCFVLWLAAWRSAVGAAWRGPVVAAQFAALFLLAWREWLAA